VATVSNDNTSKIWYIGSSNTNWTLILSYTGHTSWVNVIESINEDIVATGSSDCTIKMWSIKNGTTSLSINTKYSVYALQLLSNGLDLAAGLYTGLISVYNINNGSLVFTLYGHTLQVNDFVLINNDLLVSSSGDKTTIVWDLISKTVKFNLTGHTSGVSRLKLISTDLLVSGSWDKTIKLWNLTSRTLIRTLANHTNSVYLSIDFLNSQTLLSGSLDNTIKLWNLSSGECLNTIKTGLTIRALTTVNLTMIG
jgi:WD40 repeat protein